MPPMARNSGSAARSRMRETMATVAARAREPSSPGSSLAGSSRSVSNSSSDRADTPRSESRERTYEGDDPVAGGQVRARRIQNSNLAGARHLHGFNVAEHSTAAPHDGSSGLARRFAAAAINAQSRRSPNGGAEIFDGYVERSVVTRARLDYSTRVERPDGATRRVRPLPARPCSCGRARTARLPRW